MNSASTKLLALIILALAVGSCRDKGDDLINPNDRYCTTPYDQFQAFWAGMAQSYVFWDTDTVNWLARRDEFAPKFLELQQQEYVSSSALAGLYQDLTDGLLDHHLRIEVKNRWAAPGQSSKIDFYPGIREIQRRPGFHPLIPAETFEAVYAAYVRSGQLTNLRSATALAGGSPTHIASGIFNGTTAYIRFSNFVLTDLLYNCPDFTDADLGYDNPAAVDAYKAWANAIERPEITRAIIDMRSNLGGEMNDILLTTSLLTDRNIHLADTRAKTGPGPLDYGPWTPLEIRSEADGPRPYTIVLTDTWSCSMAELTAMAAPLLPAGGTIVGERSFGGTGPRTSIYPITFNGMFSTIDGALTITMATWQTRFMPGGQRLEGIGVTPTIRIATDPQAMAQGRDPQLAKALSL